MVRSVFPIVTTASVALAGAAAWFAAAPDPGNPVADIAVRLTSTESVLGPLSPVANEPWWINGGDHSLFGPAVPTPTGLAATASTAAPAVRVATPVTVVRVRAAATAETAR